MKQFTIVHEISCDPDRFWRTFFDPAYNEALYRDALAVTGFQVLALAETEHDIDRTITGLPKLELPAAARRVLGDRLAFTERGRFDKRAQRWRFDFTMSAFGDKVRSEGVIRLEPAGPDRVRRIGECAVEARMFGVGGMIEANMETTMRSTWAAGAQFTNRWLLGG